jgi:hypothetical protein
MKRSFANKIDFTYELKPVLHMYCMTVIAGVWRMCGGKGKMEGCFLFLLLFCFEV